MRASAARDNFVWAHENSLRAWLCFILRNQFFSMRRKAWRSVEDPDMQMALRMSVAPDAQDRIDLDDTLAEFFRLPEVMSDSLSRLAVGESYDEAALAIGVPVGTVKSRVTRARAKLRKIMGRNNPDIGGWM
jgi:RNA polymerase sigma-70 factor (ECF subfamily)